MRQINYEELKPLMDRHDFLNRNPPHCPKCGADQVQIKERDVPARWKCRICKHWFDHEPKGRTYTLDQIEAERKR